jgi:hypothetical protein
MSVFSRATSFFIPKFRQVAHFVTKQGIAVVGNLVYGLLCVRILPVPDYAKFAVLFGYMGSLTVLLDIGIAATLAPLVGEQITNLPLIANYVASIRKLIVRLYMVMTPLAAVGFVLLVHRQHWGWAVVTQMLVVLLATAWFARVSSSYGSVLILRRDRNQYYRAQIIGSLGSLGLLAIFWVLHRMNLYVAILLNVGQIVFIAFTYYQRAQKLLGVKGKPSSQQERTILRLVMPNLPATIFYAAQGQVMLMLITFFGHTTSSVANMGALSRLSQILVFFAQMNPILVEPFFAKLQESRVRRTYLLAVALVAICAAAYSGLAFFFPEIFLWILGPQYSHLRLEVSLVVLSSAIQFVAGFLWVIHSARRFIYWWSNLTHIALTLIVQVVLIWKFDLSTVRNVLYFNIASAGVALLVMISTGVYGFWRGPQKMERATA